MDYDSLDELFIDVEQDLNEIAYFINEKIREIAERIIEDNIYSYEPKFYERKDEFKNSLQTKVYMEGETIKAEVYFSNQMHSLSNWKDENKTMEGIAEYFADGEDPIGRQIDIIEQTEETYVKSNLIINDVELLMREKGYDF